MDSSYADCPQEFYDTHLADAPGWKVGGWPPWGRTDPSPRYCTVCDAPMVPLLTIASFEWDGGEGHSWAPYEDQDAANVGNTVGHCCGQNPSQPTKVEVGSTDNMQIYVCPTSPEHPHTDLIQ
ncbi:hypothetical protein ACIRG8_17655 [Streptomyces sp. NPDC102359]|uniref:hypothetical protein n=1 Tax=Streptomyces sp. NPDC102359 TaxID=3366159 RepID=UPI00382B19C5